MLTSVWFKRLVEELSTEVHYEYANIIIFPSSLILISRKHCRKSTWQGRPFGWQWMVISTFLSFWSQTHFLFSVTIFVVLSISPHRVFHHLLPSLISSSNFPFWLKSLYRSPDISTSQSTQYRQGLMFLNIIYYLHICRQTVWQIQQRFMHCSLIL